MLERIVAALRARSELVHWSVRKVTSRSVQLYAVPRRQTTRVEARREVQNERYLVEVFRHTPGPAGAITSGSGNATLLPDDDIEAALDLAARKAALVHNQPHTFPGQAPLPTVPIADPQLQATPTEVVEGLLARLQRAVAQEPHIRLTAAEFFTEEKTTQLCNSLGIDATQTETTLQTEWVLLCRDDEREAETFVEMSRRRAEDLPVEVEVRARAQSARDTLVASPPPRYTGAVVMRGETLATFLYSGTLRTLASGAAKFSKVSGWEVGQPVFPDGAAGDPLTVFANRQLPYGIHSNCFDDEGLPARRIALIQDNVLQTFVADQRYADYLGLAPSGAFGNLELPAGMTPTKELLHEPYVEVAAFSWFNPDPITGEFASEIRLGYVVDGDKRTPFKGGALVGNVLGALANVRWSSETGFYGNYQGPTTARFAKLSIAGEDEAP